jgi:hypothetical protein
VELDCIGLGGANCVEINYIGLGGLLIGTVLFRFMWANCVELDCIGLGGAKCVEL